jgi:ketopantoate reductase
MALSMVFIPPFALGARSLRAMTANSADWAEVDSNLPTSSISQHADSMALDIARCAPTEIDKLTGFIVREGERFKVPARNCRAVSRRLKGLQLAAQRRVAKPR